MKQFSAGLLSGVLLLAISFTVGASAGSSPRDEEHEVEHLIEFIGHSGCIFVRNDSAYSGVRAREHIQGKYNRLKKRKRELSAEQFISYAASRSSLSQKPYKVQCGAETITSERWLLEELEHYRQSSVVQSPDFRAQ